MSLIFKINHRTQGNFLKGLSSFFGLKTILRNDLVVLSACETSRGKLSKGEGIMSLARGFAFSGCQSMVTTLWPVNHSATAQIMESFYQNLNLGSDKSKALHDAKISYINSEKTDQNSAYPYYWSAYSLVGNTDPVDNVLLKLLALLAILISGLLLFAFYKYGKP